MVFYGNSLASKVSVHVLQINTLQPKVAKLASQYNCNLGLKLLGVYYKFCEVG